MRKSVIRALAAIVIVCLTSSLSVAQGRSSGELPFSPRKQLATIVFAGLGGAVLGLSTLSFYGRPQDHLDNIRTGFAVGIIAGTGFVTYQTVAYSQLEPMYKLESEPEMYASIPKAPVQFSWKFSF